MKPQTTILLIFASILFKFSNAQDAKKFESYYGKPYYWSKAEAKRELKSCPFWNDLKRRDVIADIGAYSGHIDLAISMFYDSLTFYLQETQAERLNKNAFVSMQNYYTQQNGKPITNKFNFVIGSNYHTNLPDSAFDKVFMNSVFEYISRYDLYLIELKSKLKKNGKVYVKTDNPFKDVYFIKIFEAYGFTCESSARKGGWLGMTFNTKAKSNTVNDIFDAVIQKDYEKTKAFLDKGVSANSALGTASLLQIAGSISNNQKILQLLIDKGGNLNDDKFFVYTPLGKLASAGEYDVVKLFIDNGAKATHEALIMSAWFGHDVRIVKLLVEKGAKIYGDKGDNNDVLRYAARSGDLEIIKYLLSQIDNNDIYKKDKEGASIIHWAALGYNKAVMKYLLEENKFNINEKDNEGMTVLMYAVYGGSIEMIKYLVGEKQMDVNKKNNSGYTALHYALDPEALNYLVSQGATQK